VRLDERKSLGLLAGHAGKSHRPQAIRVVEDGHDLLSDSLMVWSACPIACIFTLLLWAAWWITRGIVHKVSMKSRALNWRYSCQVLEAAGVNIRLSVAEAAQPFKSPPLITGWAYLDQQHHTQSVALQEFNAIDDRSVPVCDAGKTVIASIKG